MSRAGNRKKGMEYQKEVGRILEAEGFDVEIVNPKLVWVWSPKSGRRIPVSLSGDYFGRFDIIAIKAGEVVRLIQVGVHEDSSHKKKQIAGFPFSPHYTQEIWLRIRKVDPHYQIMIADPDGFLDGGRKEIVKK